MMPAYKDDRTKPARWRWRKQLVGPDGRVHRLGGTPPINTKAAAEADERRAIERLFAPTGPAAKEEKTISQHADIWIGVGCATNKPRTLQSKRQILARDILPRFGDLRPSEIYQLDVDAFVAAELAAGTARKTIANKAAVLSSLLKYAAANGHPTNKIRFGLKFDKPRLVALPEHHIAKLLEAADPRMAAAICLAADAGCRVGEVRGLRWADVNHLHNELHIDRAIGTDAIEGPTKGWRKRSVPITERLAAALAELPRPGRYIIAKKGGAPVSYALLRDGIRKLYARAGVARPAQPWHSLRHAFCTRLADRGAPIHLIRALAGHQDITTTQQYMHADRDAKRSAIDALNDAKPAPELGRVIPLKGGDE